MPPIRSTQLGVAHETKVVSAHRTPKRLYDYAHSAKDRGLKLVIAGAGGAAHLPGMTASMTSLPVLGVPIESQALKGMDSLLSIVQMPAGVPVGTLAIGKAGAVNAGAARSGDARDAATTRSPHGSRPGARSRRDRSPKRPNDGRAGNARSGSSAAASSAGCSAWRRPSSATNATSSTRTSAPARPTSRLISPRAAFDDRRSARRASASRSMSPPTSSRICRSRRSSVLGDKLRPSPRSLAIAQDRAREKAFIERLRRAGRRRGAPSRASPTSRQRSPSSACPLVLKTRRYGYDGKGQAWIRSRREARSRLGSDRRGAGGRRSRRRLRRRILGHRRALGGRPARLLGFARERAWRRHPSPLDRPVQRRRSRCRSPKRARRRCASPRRSAMSACSPSSSSPARDGPVVNEIAPRVHNSGHWTIEGAVTSQFEQHIRAICDLPPGSTDLAGRGAVMDNLIGDEVDRWPELVAEPARARPHLRQGRSSPRPQDGPRYARPALRRFDHLDRHSELLELRPDLRRIADDDPHEALGIERRARRLVERRRGLRAILRAPASRNNCRAGRARPCSSSRPAPRPRSRTSPAGG